MIADTPHLTLPTEACPVSVPCASQLQLDRINFGIFGKTQLLLLRHGAHHVDTNFNVDIHQNCSHSSRYDTPTQTTRIPLITASTSTTTNTPTACVPSILSVRTVRTQTHTHPSRLATNRTVFCPAVANPPSSLYPAFPRYPWLFRATSNVSQPHFGHSLRTQTWFVLSSSSLRKGFGNIASLKSHYYSSQIQLVPIEFVLPAMIEARNHTSTMTMVECNSQ